jgi:ABC-type transport system substrate-binding protein
MSFTYTRRGFITGIAAAGTLLGGAALLGGCSFPLERLRDRFIKGEDGADGGADDSTDGSADGGPVATKGGGTLHVASHWPYSLDPFYLQEFSGVQIASCLFDPLMRYDYRTARLLPAAAKNWEVYKGGTVFVFKLVEDAYFHNGELVTAADFKYGWERLLKPDVSGSLSVNASYLSAIEGAEALIAGEADEITGIQAQDRLTLEVTFTFPFHEFLEVLTYPTFSPVPASKAGKDPLSFELWPTGNGAFMMSDTSSWQDAALKLERFDDYRGQMPLLSAVEFRFFAAGQAQSDESLNEDELWQAAGPVAGPTAGPVAAPGMWQAAAPTAGPGLWQAVAGPRLRQAITGSRLQKAIAASRLQKAAIGPRLRKAADDVPVTYEEKTYESFTYGELDVASVPAAALEDARLTYGESTDGYTATPGGQTLLGSETCTEFLLLNLEREPLTDVNVRRALSYAIDREAICKELYFDSYFPATGIIPPDIEGFRDGAWPPATYNINKAKQALAEAGYPKGEGLAPITLVVFDSENERALFKMIEADLKAVGFKVKTEVGASGERLAALLANSAVLTRAGWIADFPIMESFLTPLFASFGSYNQFEYHNAAVDEGIAAARAIALKKDRIEAFQAVEDLIVADMPAIPLFFTRHTLVCSDRTNDLYIAPDGLIDLKKAWLAY